jgi:hypothetical protein
MLAALTGWLDVRWVVALIVALAGSASVGAQEYRGTEEQRMACAGDVFKLCMSEIPNVSRIVGCLERQKHQLSAGCRAVFDNNSVRVAYDRWQRRHHHLASAVDRSQPAQAERRDEASSVALIKPVNTGSVTAAKDIHAVTAAQGTDLRSKSAVRDVQRRSKVAHRGSHRRYKTALRHSHPKHRAGHHHLNRYAFTFGKQYRYHYQQHSMFEASQSERVAREFGRAKD